MGEIYWQRKDEGVMKKEEEREREVEDGHEHIVWGVRREGRRGNGTEWEQEKEEGANSPYYSESGIPGCFRAVAPNCGGGA